MAVFYDSRNKINSSLKYTDVDKWQSRQLGEKPTGDIPFRRNADKQQINI